LLLEFCAIIERHAQLIDIFSAVSFLWMYAKNI